MADKIRITVCIACAGAGIYDGEVLTFLEMTNYRGLKNQRTIAFEDAPASEVIFQLWRGQMGPSIAEDKGVYPCKCMAFPHNPREEGSRGRAYVTLGAVKGYRGKASQWHARPAQHGCGRLGSDKESTTKTRERPLHVK
ncbi:hypothetical protein VNO77_03684 [Canavalia gladiata]|uniref:Uncharacterized protein n=1 Tax=Canavalia gladiata TaxID=3824 RepID=A0AAN9N0U1_CANGL